MNDIKTWETELMTSLYNQKKKGSIHNFNFNSPLSEERLTKINEQKFDEHFVDFYKLYDGLTIAWSTKDQIGAELSFMQMKYVMQDWLGKLYDKYDLEQNDLLEFYRPFCQISETFSCGFLVTPDFTGKSVYCHNSPSPELYNLDLDFYGFLKMSKASEIYHYWPKVLLDFQSGTLSLESDSLKTNLPKVFPAFNWVEYDAFYQSLRLSKSDSKIENS